MPTGSATLMRPPTYVNVMTFNAYGLGADYTAAIQAAANYLSSIGGGALYIPAGLYLISSDIVVPSNVTIIGDGRATILRQAIGSSCNIFNLTNVSHVSICNLQLDGNSANVTQPATQYLKYAGVWMNGSDDVTITDCYIHSFWSSGIMANGGDTDLLISNNRMVGNWDNQIYIRALNSSPYTICSSVTISGNVCSGGSYSGIQCLGSSYISITGNVCYSNGPTSAQGDGIGSEGSSYVTITGNTCYSNGIQGINIRGTLEMGATPVRSAHVVVADNIIYNHSSSDGDAGGISLTDCDDVLVEGNLTETNYFGINITDVMNGSGSPGETNITLRGNKVRSNTNGGIRMYCGNSSTFIFEDNEVTDTGNGNPNIRANQRVWIKGGICARATGSGIPEGIALDSGSSGTVIEGVSIFDNADNGILVGGSGVANVIIRECHFDNVTTTAQTRAVYENGGCGPTIMIHNRIQNMNYQNYSFVNGSSRYYDLAPAPFALYDGELGQTSSQALTANGVYLVGVVLNAPVTLTGVRLRFAAGGSGHYDVGIYDSSGTNGAPGNLLAHAAATSTSLATATGTQSPTFTGGNLNLAPGKYWLAVWVDNATDTVNKQSASGNMAVIQSGTVTAGPLPAAASSITGLANATVKPLLIGLISGSWS